MSETISQGEMKGRVREGINDEPAQLPVLAVETSLSPFEIRYAKIVGRDGEECAQLAVDAMQTYGCGLDRAAEIVSYSAEYAAARARYFEVLREAAAVRRAARAAAAKRSDLVLRLDGARSGVRASEAAIERLEDDIKRAAKLRATAGTTTMTLELERLRGVLVKQQAAAESARADIAAHDAQKAEVAS